jgi:hypothetical protein
MEFNKKKLSLVILNKGKPESISKHILDFVESYKFTVINKYELIDEKLTKFNLRIKKNNKEIFLNLKISKDYLFTSSINYKGNENKIVTRDLEEIKNFLLDIFLR